MSTWIHRPESVRLELSGGDWVAVRKYLTAGDTRRMFGRMIRDGATGDKVDPLLVGVAKITAYVLDWSVTDADDKPIALSDVANAEATILAVLDMLDPDRYRELERAIDAHEDRVAAEKKIPHGVTPLSPISQSPGFLVGATNG